MRALRLACLLASATLAACAGRPEKGTLAQLHDLPPDVAEVEVEQGLDKAMQSYRRYLDETPRSDMTPEAMRRLADLQLEKEFGIRGDGKLIELAAPEEAGVAVGPAVPQAATGVADLSESDKDFEQRTTGALEIAPVAGEAPLPAGTAGESAPSGPLEAIALYDRLLAEYPDFEHNDQVLYQKARAYDELGRTEEAMATMERLVSGYQYSGHYDEVQFRRAEYFFTRRKFRDAENAYQAIISMGASSSYHELALYKLGWTLYKQDFYDEAQHQFIALLDYKVSIGYDFDQAQHEDEERRIADTFRVISLGFSNLGGPEVVQEYFAANGHRSYEDRIYANLGEFYFAKLRYDDAAKTYKAFVDLNPFHRSSPHFGMRVVEIYTRADFPKLVLEAKKEFASRYGLQAEYWRHFDVNESPDVLSYLKGNLSDLANHYHALYQAPELAADKPANFAEAERWYRDFLVSFPKDSDTPAINYQLADLLLENQSFGEAALQYERTAYDYPAHGKSAAAGYAAIYAHRQNLKGAPEELQGAVRTDTVASSLRFADAFPQHEHAPAVLGAAADDLYGMKEFRPAIDAARKLIDRYPGAELPLRRAAWTVVAHASFDLAEFPQAEQAYASVLEITPQDDAARQALVDNLAASIYKQGEQANAQLDYRAAADHFLRVKQAAPASAIRAAAEYDAGAALIRIEDWAAAASVLEAFRSTYPDHELNREATRQIAFVYRQNGQLGRAASEYERVAAESSDANLRGEALLVAGELYEQSSSMPQALAAYTRYVEEFPRPIETAVELRFKIAGMHQAAHDEPRYYQELEQIVRIDAQAGAERTNRTRTVAARSALALSEQLYHQFADLPLRQPFEASLKEKKRRMDAAIEALGGLVDYQVGDVTAAATFYMAEIYYGLSRALMESERPAGLQAADLQEYELALEDEAYPFEERAIEVHEKNMELMRTGLYNAWINRSLDKLADLMPARYAKGEISSGFVGSLDRYAYSAPVVQQPAAAVDGAGEASPAAVPVEPREAPAGPEAAPAAPPEHTSRVQGPSADAEVSIANAN
jgi:tetratricopeptide (TPR) repeat protein